VQIAIFSLFTLAVAKPLGLYLVRVFDGSVKWLRVIGAPDLRAFAASMKRRTSTGPVSRRVLLFSLVSMLLTYVRAALQHLLPLNPQQLPGCRRPSGLRDGGVVHVEYQLAVYVGETTMSYFSQMTQLAFHNFSSAAVGIAVAVALVRGIARRGEEARGRSATSGSTSRAAPFMCCCHVTRPVAAVRAAGRDPELQAVSRRHHARGRQADHRHGPVASQEIIKQLGTNGGGFFNANSAHPFENPTPWTNFWSMVTIFMIPSALVYLLGRMTRNTKHGWAVWAAMFVAVLRRRVDHVLGRSRGNPIHARAASTSTTDRESRRQHGREGGPLRHRQLRALSPSSPPTPRAAR
jgi:K+-transporting ATPase ATPase A chain